MWFTDINCFFWDFISFFLFFSFLLLVACWVRQTDRQTDFFPLCSFPPHQRSVALLSSPLLAFPSHSVPSLYLSSLLSCISDQPSVPVPDAPHAAHSAQVHSRRSDQLCSAQWQRLVTHYSSTCQAISAPYFFSYHAMPCHPSHLLPDCFSHR